LCPDGDAEHQAAENREAGLAPEVEHEITSAGINPPNPEKLRAPRQMDINLKARPCLDKRTGVGANPRFSTHTQSPKFPIKIFTKLRLERRYSIMNGPAPQDQA
jgi:hypothetical protein